ncbi:MAG TPA: peptide ABC transporter substrate-binding protein, partial [Candidatus Saccharimonadales bacterium]|nr:peptide ABC transporter substrate-binding protein [Candidatus Saccharimonadales bacterium]
AQLFESLTSFDPGLTVRPALAQSWDVLDGGQRIVFHLRPGLEFSDGSPLTAGDVVRSWLRVIDPAHPSPLASLLTDVAGVSDYLAGRSHDPGSVGLTAQGSDVVVQLRQPAADFPQIIASPTFAVVPPGVGTSADALTPGPGFVASGGYRATARTATTITLVANDHYWAGTPAISPIKLVTDIGGQSPVQQFQDGALDYTAISDFDASWIQYDSGLGPSLRSVPSLGVTYYGFTVTTPPFNDVHVRRAFAMAVNWHRIVNLAGPASQVPATSMVPPGIEGHPMIDDSPPYDPAAAKAELAAAGYPGGRGFPSVTLVTEGGGYDDAVVAELKSVLGVTVHTEFMNFQGYFQRLATDPPAFWSMAWSADYPGANDFLGILLGTGEANNFGHWSDPAFDAAIQAARSATNETDVIAAFDQAQAIVRDQAPVVPTSYGTGWALARPGLLGAVDNGLGIVRFAGLSWAK